MRLRYLCTKRFELDPYGDQRVMIRVREEGAQPLFDRYQVPAELVEAARQTPHRWRMVGAAVEGGGGLGCGG